MVFTYVVFYPDSIEYPHSNTSFMNQGNQKHKPFGFGRY
jgi:hypothetical protein